MKALPGDTIRSRHPWKLRVIGVLITLIVALVLALMWWWDKEPPAFDVRAAAAEHAVARSP